MKPLEFVLWLNGISELLGDQPPSAEQWATIRAGLSRSVGEVVKSRILELAASEQVKHDTSAKALTSSVGQAQSTIRRDITTGTF